MSPRSLRDCTWLCPLLQTTRDVDDYSPPTEARHWASGGELSTRDPREEKPRSAAIQHLRHRNNKTAVPMTLSNSATSVTAGQLVGAPPGFPDALSHLFTRPASSIPLLPAKAFDPSLKSAIHREATSRKKWSPALEASVHLLNDDLNAAHEIVTDREDEMECNLSHAVLHRRGECWRRRAGSTAHQLISSPHSDVIPSRHGCMHRGRMVEFPVLGTPTVSPLHRRHLRFPLRLRRLLPAGQRHGSVRPGQEEQHSQQ